MLRKSGLIFAMVVMLLAGCSGNNANNSEPNTTGQTDTGQEHVNDQVKTEPKEEAANNQTISDKPVTLYVWTGANDENFKKEFQDRVAKEYPNITLKKYPLQSDSLAKLLSAGTPPDLLHGSKNHMIFQALPTKMVYDLTDLIKKYNFNVDRIKPELMESMYSFSDNDDLYALPYSQVLHGNMYNKDVFDKFAVSYPEDDMTWDEAIQLAKQIARVEEGVQYRGLDVQFYNMVASQLNLAAITPEGKPNMANWTRPASIYKQIFDIPNNNTAPTGTIAKTSAPFLNSELAMLVINANVGITAMGVPDLRWDWVTVPTYPEAPETDPYMNYSFISIAPTSDYKEEAFKVIAYLLSDDIQTENSRAGNPSTLASPEIQGQFGADIEGLSEKNIQALFKHRQSDPYVSPYHTSEIETMIKVGFNDLRAGKYDINTMLRQLDEQIAAKIEEIKSTEEK